MSNAISGSWRVGAARVLSVAAACATILLTIQWVAGGFDRAPAVPRSVYGVFTADRVIAGNVAITVITGAFAAIASAFALFGVALARIGTQSASGRQIMVAMGFGSAALAWFTYGATLSPITRILASPAPFGFYADALVAGIGAYAAANFARFFIWYPRTITETEWFEGQLAWRNEPRSGWTDVLYRGGRRQVAPAKVKYVRREFRLITAPAFPLACALLATFSILYLDALLVSLLPVAHGALRSFVLLLALPVVLFILIPMACVAMAFNAIEIQHRAATGPERIRIAWVRMSMKAASVAGPFGAMLLIPIAIAYGTGVMFPYAMLLCVLVLAAVVAGLAASAFYHGTIDPRLAVGKTSAWVILGIVVTFIFLLIERFVAVHAAQAFGWSPETGGVLAGAVTALTIAPIKTRAEQSMRHLADRWLPMESTEGDRVLRTVCFTDLSGYSRASAVDEPRALLLAAILLHQGRRIAAEHRGRIVKSMGDALIWEFESATDALGAMDAFGPAFNHACAQAGVQPLPLHTGVHTGEVVRTTSGDLFGATVNLASRIQDFAQPGQTVFSAAAVTASGAGNGRVQSMGEQTFKNIPHPTTCFLVLPSAG